jgi:hypothetical protein
VAEVSVEEVVQRPPEIVFDFVATHHFENHPRWDPDVVEMIPTSPEPSQVGATARVVRRQGGRLIEGTATVREYQPPLRAAWQVQFGAFWLDQRAEFISHQGGAATRLRLSIGTRAKGPLALIMPLLRGRSRKTMSQSLVRIAALLEQD